MTTRPTDKEVEDLCNAFVRDNPAMFREHTITFAVKLGNGEVAHTTPPRPAPYRIMGVKFFDPRAQPLTKAQIDFVSLVSLHFGQVLPFGVEGALPIAVLNDALPLLDPCPAGVPARFVFWSSRPITLAVQLTVALVHQ